MATDRRAFLTGVGTIGIATTAGCVGGFGEEGNGEDGGNESQGGSGNESGNDSDNGDGGGSANVGMVYATGGLGDNSFNDMAQQGLLDAEEEFGVSYSEAEPESNGEFEGAQRDFAEGDYDLVSCIGFAQEEALTSNASEYGDQNFMIVDAEVDADNVRSYVFGEPEGSFQVGHLAGLLTDMEFEAGAGSTNPEESVVGFVGGVESPLIESFQAGFEAGVDHADTGAEVVSSYVGEFNDTAGGQETARSMFEGQGADIVYHAAGATGVGVFQAAQDQGRFAIGVDADQSVTESDYADVILASMVKRVDSAVYTAIESVVDDAFAGGETEVLGLEQDGVEAVYGQEIGGEIPDEVVEAVDSSRQAIIDGEIEVPDTLE
ncbi:MULTISPECIES: BMP family lipoprotein [Saliphagus]|uniref:BMP family protein n=1 Tax=Saliphagus infecundisoli TaxID=1849069 RepID=A0ABD5QKN1_9EURY|nr:MULTISPECIES: BMP family protein [Saliphagus]